MSDTQLPANYVVPGHLQGRAVVRRAPHFRGAELRAQADFHLRVALCVYSCLPTCLHFGPGKVTGFPTLAAAPAPHRLQYPGAFALLCIGLVGVALACAGRCGD